MQQQPLSIRETGEFKYIDEGEGPILLLVHGLFGALSNWADVTRHFSRHYRVIIPMIPIYEMPLREKNAGLDWLAEYLEEFIVLQGLETFSLLGNSLGGHLALIYTLRNPQKVESLVLTGSSGLFENTMGGSFPRRGSYDYINERVAYTFYDPEIATKELVEEIFEVTRSIPKCQRVVVIARSAQRHNMAESLPQIDVPTLLVWGLNDTITPPYVGHEFNRLIPRSELRFIDECCHAPMMEKPEIFNRYVEDFLRKTTKKAA